MINQIFVTFAPLLTTPYVSRVLGSANLGIFTFTLSVVNYFVLFAMLGITTYGTRTIAEDCGDKNKISKHFWEIYSIQLMSAGACTVLYILYLLVLRPDNLVIAAVQILWLFSAWTDLWWFYYGVEEVRFPAILGTVIKIMSVIGIFVFVRRNDSALLMYTLIMGGSNYIGMLMMLIPLKEYVIWQKPNWQDIKTHIRPVLVLFVPLLAMSVFHNMDKTMIGLLSSYPELGFYRNAELIINVPLSIVNTLTAVFLTRSTILMQEEDKSEYVAFLSHSYEAIICIAALLSFGIAGCVRIAVPLFFGSEFMPCIDLTYLFVPVLIIKSVSGFYRMQYLIPSKKEKIYIIATFAGAAVNLIVNMILIPLFGAKGAVVGTISAECALMIIQFYPLDERLPYGSWLKETFAYCLIGLLMTGFMMLIDHQNLSVLVKLAAEIIGGAAVYGIMCLFYWKYISKDETLMNMVGSKLKRND